MFFQFVTFNSGSLKENFHSLKKNPLKQNKISKQRNKQANKQNSKRNKIILYSLQTFFNIYSMGSQTGNQHMNISVVTSIYGTYHSQGFFVVFECPCSVSSEGSLKRFSLYISILSNTLLKIHRNTDQYQFIAHPPL